MESIESWAEEELKQVNLGGQRLNTRFKELINQFSKNPQASINHALEDWTSTKAAYRFFKNEKVSEKNILASHIQNTVSRCKGSLVGIGALFRQQSLHACYESDELAGIGKLLEHLGYELSVVEDILRCGCDSRQIIYKNKDKRQQK